MKKILGLGVLLFSILGVFAQNNIRIGLQVSPLIGYATLTDENNNDLTDQNPSTRLGFAYGLVGEFGFTDNYGIHTGVNIVTRGYSYQPGSAAEKLKWRATTVQVPVAAVLRSAPINDNIYIKGLFGVSLDFQVGHAVEYLELTNANPPTFNTVSSKNTDRINPLGLTFMVGPGVDVDLTTGTLGFAVVYNQGLTNLNNSKNGFLDTRIKSNFIALNMAYFF